MHRFVRTELAFVATGLVLAAGALTGGCSDDETTGPSGTTTETTTTTTTSTITTSSNGGGGTGGTGQGGQGGTGGALVGGGGSGGGTGGSGGGTGGSGGGTGGTGGGGTGGAGGGAAGGGTGGAGGGAGGGGTGGAGGNPTLSETAYYYGDFQTDLTHQVGLVAYPGPTQTVLSLDALTAGNDIGGLAVSPDGTKIAVAGRDVNGGMYVVNLYAADGSGLATNLATGPQAFTNYSDLAFSPDGQYLAYLGDEGLSGATELYVVPTTGGPSKRVSQQLAAGANDVTTFAWQPDVSGNLKYLAFQADPVTDNVFSLYTVEITAAVPAPVNVVPEAVAGLGVGTGVPQFDATGRVYFRGDFEVDNLFRLYRANIDGTQRVQVPGTSLTNNVGEASVGSLGMSPDGTKLAFGSESPTATNYQVFVLDLAGNTAVQVSNVASGITTGNNIGPDFATPVAWSHDQQHLAVRADWPVANDANDNDISAFVLPASGAAGGVRVVHVPQGANQDVEQVAFSTNSARLFIRGDVVVNNDNILVSTTDFATADQDPATLVVQGVVTAGDVNGLVIAP